MKWNETQIGGDHYRSMAIQPLEYSLANGLGPCETNVVKYVSRWKAKGGVEDLRKARHYIEALIDWEINSSKLSDMGAHSPNLGG